MSRATSDVPQSTNGKYRAGREVTGPPTTRATSNSTWLGLSAPAPGVARRCVIAMPSRNRELDGWMDGWVVSGEVTRKRRIGSQVRTRKGTGATAVVRATHVSSQCRETLWTTSAVSGQGCASTAGLSYLAGGISVQRWLASLGAQTPKTLSAYRDHADSRSTWLAGRLRGEISPFTVRVLHPTVCLGIRESSHTLKPIFLLCVGLQASCKAATPSQLLLSILLYLCPSFPLPHRVQNVQCARIAPGGGAPQRLLRSFERTESDPAWERGYSRGTDRACSLFLRGPETRAPRLPMPRSLPTPNEAIEKGIPGHWALGLPGTSARRPQAAAPRGACYVTQPVLQSTWQRNGPDLACRLLVRKNVGLPPK